MAPGNPPSRGLSHHDRAQPQGRLASGVASCSSPGRLRLIPSQAGFERLQRAWQQTFWANHVAYEFQQACLALAKRGMNVNCITLMWGPGGVGLSRFTSWLASMLGDNNHCMFDPSIFFDDNELRKRIEMMSGRIVYTGQERPTNTKQKMRVDVVKKVATAEGLAGRMPYGKVTRTFCLQGWKRLELNDLLDFGEIKEGSYEAIRRRFGVIKFSARFLEEPMYNALKRVLGDIDPASLGLFVRDYELDDFLVSGVAAAAGLKGQYAFEQQNNLQQCRAKILHYSRGGGDQGASDEYLRKACNLPAVGPEKRDVLERICEDLQAEDPVIPEAAPAPGVASDASLHAFFRETMQEKDYNIMTKGYVTQTKLPAHIKATKDTVWKTLLASDEWRNVGKRLRSENSLVPVLLTRKPVGVLYAPPEMLEGDHVEAQGLSLSSLVGTS